MRRLKPCLPCKKESERMTISLPSKLIPLGLALLVILQSTCPGQAAWFAKKRAPAGPQNQDVIQLTDDWQANRNRPESPLLAYTHAFPQDQWWQVFHNPVVDQLVKRAFKNNPDLLAAEKQVDEARSLSLISRSALLPSLNVGAQYLWQKYSKYQFIFPVDNFPFSSYQLPLSASYELDLSGKNRKAYQASKEQVKAAQYQHQNAVIQLSALVVSTYFNVLRQADMLAAQQEIVALSEAYQRHAQAFYAQGQSTADEQDAASLILETQRSTLAAMQSSRHALINQLLALIGEPPSQADWLNQLLTGQQLDTILIPSSEFAGLPEGLVTHRPDIAVMEASMKAADLNLEAARRAFFPSIMLNAQTGLNAVSFRNLFTKDAISTLAGAALDQPLYQGGAIKAGYHYRKAQAQEMIQRYRSTLINAFGDAENSLAALNADVDIYQSVLNQYQVVAGQARHEQNRVRVGLTSEVSWIPKEIERLQFQQALAQQKTELLNAHISVVKALGGGFLLPAP